MHQNYGMQQYHYNSHARKASARRGLPGTDTLLRISLVANVVFLLSLLLVSQRLDQQQQNQLSFQQHQQQPQTTILGYNQQWHGGHPSQDRSGACWCGGDDQYCMCTPNLAIDLIITSSSISTSLAKDPSNPSSTTTVAAAAAADSVWLIRRQDTDQLATMGGFVDINETVEYAVQRELREEMGYDLFSNKNSKHHNSSIRLVGVYSDPRRDNRRRTVSAVFAVHVMDEDFQPHAGDDAKEVIRISMDDIEKHTYFSDHRTILLDYRAQLRGESYRLSTEGDFAPDVVRSTCSGAAAASA